MARHALEQEADSRHVSAGGEPPAARAYDKLNAQLSPLLGAAGVQLLFARSAKMASGAIPAGLPLSDAAKVRERLATPGLSEAVTVELFAHLLTLIATFIGDRLTVQVLRSAWPTLDAADPVEKKQ